MASDQQFLNTDGLASVWNKIKQLYVDTYKISLTLSPNDWTNNELILYDDAFFSDDAYSYIVSPSPDSHYEYCKAGIYADIKTDGQITFHCSSNSTVPTNTLTVNILRL